MSNANSAKWMWLTYKQTAENEIRLLLYKVYWFQVHSEDLKMVIIRKR